jgi:hypothetical protein
VIAQNFHTRDLSSGTRRQKKITQNIKKKKSKRSSNKISTTRPGRVGRRNQAKETRETFCEFLFDEQTVLKLMKNEK